MGGSAFSTDVYRSNVASRAATGTSAFGHTDAIRSGREAAQVHELMDPNGVAVRESRDNDDNPNSVAIAVLFDVTGSMQRVPVELQTKLGDLMELLRFKQYVDDPQVLFGAIGDATTDNAPLQVGQFEADNRMEDWLGRIYLEGNGGGQNTESYELAFYFMARHTATDCFEKRGHKGYLFVIGDEHPYPGVKPNEVGKVIGDVLGEPISAEAIVAEVQEKYHVFFIIPGGTSHGRDSDLLEHWQRLLGPQNVLRIDDISSVAETIALQVGISEQTIELEEGLKDLEERGTAPVTVERVRSAFATVS